MVASSTFLQGKLQQNPVATVAKRILRLSLGTEAFTEPPSLSCAKQPELGDIVRNAWFALLFFPYLRIEIIYSLNLITVIQYIGRKQRYD